MTTDSDATRIVRSWLEEGVTVLPDRVLDIVLDQLPTTPQRRAPWPVRRFAEMNNIARIAIAAAAVVVAAVVGINVLTRSQAEVGPPRPTAPHPSAQAPGSARPIFGSTIDEPGRYSVGVYFPTPFEFTIADKWETWDTGKDLVRIWKPVFDASGRADGTHSAILSFEIVRNTFADACHAIPTDQAGDGVDDLVEALTAMDSFESGPVTDVAVDGHAGKSLEFAPSSGRETAGCVGGGLAQWISNGPIDFGAGARQRITVLDVDGTRLAIAAVSYGGDALEMQEIIDSIDFK